MCVCVRACMRVCVHARVSVHVRTCVPACGCACVRVGVCIADILYFFPSSRRGYRSFYVVSLSMRNSFELMHAVTILSSHFHSNIALDWSGEHAHLKFNPPI